jgi:hypothetical protein
MSVIFRRAVRDKFLFGDALFLSYSPLRMECVWHDMRPFDRCLGSFESSIEKVKPNSEFVS